VFSRRLLLTTTFVSLGLGGITIGLTSYVPTYLSGSLGTSPIIAGLALAAMTIGWPIAAAQSGRVYLRFGFRTTILAGMVFVIAGTLVLAIFSGTPSLVLVACCTFVTGLGLGFVATPSLIAAQSSVEWNERGVVTGTNLFARSIGSSVGVAIFGAVANAIFSASGTNESSPTGVISASSSVFVSVAIVAVALVVAVLAMPRTGIPGGPGKKTAPAPA
jgi:MFS family permease